MKTFFKFIIGLILTIVILVGGTVGVLAYLVIDNTTYNNQKYESKDLNTTIPIYNLLEKSMEDTSSTENIELTLDPEDLDFLLYSIIDSIKEQVKPLIITSSKVECIDGIYYLKASVSFENINSVVDLELDFEENNNIFTIKVAELKLGKLGINNQFVHSIIDNIDISQVMNSLNSNNIYCTIDIKNLSVSISQEDLVKMTSKLSTSNQTYKIIEILLDIYVNDHDLYEFKTSDYLSFILHLNKLKYNSSYGELVDIGLEEIEILTETLLANKVITNIQTNEVFNYLLNGYSPLPEESKKVIDSINFSSIGITDNKLYKGKLIKNNTPMSSYISNMDLDYQLGDTSLKFELSESIINLVVQNGDIFGSSLAFGHEETSNPKYSNQVSYITIEPLIMDLKEDKIELDFIVNVHGFKLGIHADFTTEEHSGLTIEGMLTNLLIGEISLNHDTQIEVLDYLNSSLSEDWISIDSSNNKIILNFEELIFENEIIKQFAQTFGDALITTSVNENNISINFGI